MATIDRIVRSSMTWRRNFAECRGMKPRPTPDIRTPGHEAPAYTGQSDAGPKAPAYTEQSDAGA
jgi:hypothetical protein